VAGQVPGSVPAARGRLALSGMLLITLLGAGWLLGFGALLRPGYLAPGPGCAVGGLAAGDVMLAGYIWFRRGFSMTREKTLVGLCVAHVVLACLTVQDPVGGQLAVVLFTMTTLFAALFLRPGHTAFVVVTVAAASLWVVRHGGWTWPLAAAHSATALMAEISPWMAVAVSRWHLAGALERSQRQATTDSLTGLVNHRGLHGQAPAQVRRAHQSGTSLGLLSIDIDHFKVVNDTYGHSIGDEVIRDVARLIRSCVRAEDVVVRLGGEEITVLAVLDPHDLVSLAERIRRTVVRDCAVTVSVGVAWSTPCGRDVDPELVLHQLAEEADTYLYAAKNAGRNRVSHPAVAQ
jgi:diguanylate cyclase (GGDEF)-like protein